MLAKNKNGYELLEYIPIKEEEISNYQNVTGAGVIVKVNDRYLVGYNNWRKQWELPIGGIEKGESAREAAMRELYEETHQEIDNMQFKGLFKKIRPTGEIVYTAIFYSIKENITPFIKQNDDENDEIKLWHLAENIGYIDEIDVKMIQMISDYDNEKINVV